MIQPLFKLVVVRQTETPESSSVLILPENMEDKKRYGVIEAIGDQANPLIKVGSNVLWFGECGERYEENEIEYIIMNDHDLKAIL